MIDLGMDYSYVNTGDDLFPVPPMDDAALINGELCFRIGMDYIITLTKGPIDTDKDGVPDEDDRCPEEKEDRDGFFDDDGCIDDDHDGDGILNDKDRCPTEAEDLDGWDDLDGCPDVDNDGDGVLDEDDYCGSTPLGTEVDERGCPVTTAEPPPPSEPAYEDGDEDGIPNKDDQCPSEKEDMDGYEDLDGCPDPDNDGDGIEDGADKCPTQAEDIDGFEDNDGCPETDNDQDGIDDADDKCPGTDATVSEGKDTKETRNDFEDDDGCPDEKTEKKPKVKEIKRGKMVLKGVTFEKNSVKLRDASYETLKKVFESLKAYPEIKVEVRGYTDNRGGKEHNRKLSKGRAESVKQYLVTKGIDPARLKVKGYGPASPIASNKTAAGRAKNRRIEFFRID